MFLLDLAVQSSDTRTSVNNYEQTAEVLIVPPTVYGHGPVKENPSTPLKKAP